MKFLACLITGIVSASCATTYAADSVTVYAAGSLRGVVTDLATEAGPVLGIDIHPSFGGSGSMRERIEKGEPADLLMSADLGSPRKLVDEGRAVLPAIAFARNRVCIVSQQAAHITPRNLVARLLAKNIRLKTSQPVVDPGGDYAWSIIDHIDAVHPGAGATLKAKAQASWDFKATPSEGQSAAAALFTTGQVDVTITYCSGAPALLKEVPSLTSFEVPPRFDPHPLYGVAVVTANPAAQRLALYLLSDKGQALIAREGLVPLTGPAPTP